MSLTNAPSPGFRFAEWRKQRALTRHRMAGELGITPQTLARWEKDQSAPRDGLRHRITEMMREDAAFQLALRRHVVAGLSSFVALLDVNNLIPIAVSRGLCALWPGAASLIGEDALRDLTPELLDVFQNLVLLRRIRRGEIVLARGTCWTASFASYGLSLIAEIWFDPKRDGADAGPAEFSLFDDAFDP